MWTGQKYWPVRIKMTSLHTTYCFRDLARLLGGRGRRRGRLRMEDWTRWAKSMRACRGVKMAVHVRKAEPEGARAGITSRLYEEGIRRGHFSELVCFRVAVCSSLVEPRASPTILCFNDHDMQMRRKSMGRAPIVHTVVKKDGV